MRGAGEGGGRGGGGGERQPFQAQSALSQGPTRAARGGVGRLGELPTDPWDRGSALDQ